MKCFARFSCIVYLLSGTYDVLALGWEGPTSLIGGRSARDAGCAARPRLEPSRHARTFGPTPRSKWPGRVNRRRAAGEPMSERDESSEATSTEAGARGFGLSVATALIVGSIIGVGIFNLPTSLSAYGPISLVSMGLTTRRRAGPCPAVRRAVPPLAGRRRAVRLRPGGLRQRARLRQRLVVLDHRLGRQRRHRGGLGALRRGVRQHRPQQARVGAARAGRAVDPGGHQPVGRRRTWARCRSSPRS